MDTTIEAVLHTWDIDGGCYSACTHDEWIPPDGHCRTCGAPAWLALLGTYDMRIAHNRYVMRLAPKWGARLESTCRVYGLS